MSSNRGLKGVPRAPTAPGVARAGRALAALREIGYKGWATAEVKGGNRERLADISRRMDNILGLA